MHDDAAELVVVLRDVAPAAALAETLQIEWCRQVAVDFLDAGYCCCKSFQLEHHYVREAFERDFSASLIVSVIIIIILYNLSESLQGQNKLFILHQCFNNVFISSIKILGETKVWLMN